MTTSSSSGDRPILILSILVFLFFVTQIALYYLKIDSTILGVFRELLTIPFLLGLILLVVLAFIAFRKGGYNYASMPFKALIILFVTIAIMVLGFIFP